jgi:hypothetical protein
MPSFLLRLALNCNPLDLHPTSSWDYRHEPLCQPPSLSLNLGSYIICVSFHHWLSKSRTQWCVNNGLENGDLSKKFFVCVQINLFRIERNHSIDPWGNWEPGVSVYVKYINLTVMVLCQESRAWEADFYLHFKWNDSKRVPLIRDFLVL